MKCGSTYIGVSILEQDYVLEFDYVITVEAGKPQLYGPPENCHDGWPMEYEVEDVRLYMDTPVTLKAVKKPYLELPQWMVDELSEYAMNAEDAYDAVVKDIEDYGDF